MKVFIFTIFLFSLTVNVFSQAKQDWKHTKRVTQIFTDQRDGEKYHLISTEDRYWLNENLRFKTENSNTLDDLDSNAEKLGLLYSWKEAQEVCPDGWKQPNFQDYKDLFSSIAINDKGFIAGIYSYDYTMLEFNEENPAGINIEQNGMKHKKKYRGHQSFNIWIRNEEDPSLAQHIHGYDYRNNRKEEYRFTIFVHDHEKQNSIRYKRKFGVRCVIPISEYNKLILK